MGAVILGKEAIGEAAGWAGSEVAGLITDNEQIKMIAGMASSMAAGGMSNKVDNYFNLSRKPFLSGMSVDDAARYNAYWDSLGNGTHTLPNMNAEDFARFQYGIDHLDAVYADRILADSANDILKIRNAGNVVSNIDDYLNSSRNPFITGMSADDAMRYDNWMKVREGELHIDYVQAEKKLGIKLNSDGYNIIKTEPAMVANADWYDMGFTNPPIAENTIAYTVEAGDYSYSRVYLEGYNYAMSSFIVRTDDIAGLTANEIAEKLALSKVPNKIVNVELPPTPPLEVSIVGPQPSWGTIGGDIQFAIKDVDLNPNWFKNVTDLD